MSTHLSPEEITRWMAGARTPEAERHLGECAKCAAEVERLAATLALFRASAWEWSERQEGSRAGVFDAAAPVRKRFGVRVAGWAAVAATVLLAAAVPMYRNAKTRQADTRLLEQVDAGVSRAVPRPMEPLLKLVSSSSASSDAAGDNNDETTEQK